MARARTVDRFDGRILGVGTSSGVRLVVGDWRTSPLGEFTGVMVATADGHRMLLAPGQRVADYVTSTYTFDEVVRCTVSLTEVRTPGERHEWVLRAGPLSARFGIGGRTPTGRLLRAVPRPLSRRRTFATLVDPIARLVHPGVRTRGSAGNGRQEYYGASDQHVVTDLSGAWGALDLGSLREVTPDPRFGFSSTPARPSVTHLTTTVVHGS